MPRAVPNPQVSPASVLVRMLALAALLAATALWQTAAAEPASGPGPGSAAATAVAPPEWLVRDSEGHTRVRLYVFWSRNCPHCRDALPFLERLRAEEPWLEVLDYQIVGNREYVERYVAWAEGLGERANAVPAFFVCGRMLTGYDKPEGMGAELLGLARFCRQMAAGGADSESGSGSEPGAGAGETPARAGDPSEAAPSAGGEGAPAGPAAAGAGPVPSGETQPAGVLRVPLLGPLEAGNLSLPMFTLVIAGLDAFNPCAFFVLLFLLSLMVHAGSRGRMLLIGGTFVLVSGLVYFLFMAAWLNLFLVLGGTAVVTALAGVVALLIGALNVKDFFRPGAGPSLSIPEAAKPGLFKRMGGLLRADRISAMLAGTVVLALAANSYELLCTAGFPMVFTRVLTLNELPTFVYYGYLALYNLIYVLPLLAIVLVFTFTLGARKLGEREGRVLKLVSGLMMLGLGILLLAAPDRLSNPLVGALLLGAALALAGAIALVAFRGGRAAA